MMGSRHQVAKMQFSILASLNENQINQRNAHLEYYFALSGSNSLQLVADLVKVRGSEKSWHKKTFMEQLSE